MASYRFSQEKRSLVPCAWWLQWKKVPSDIGNLDEIVGGSGKEEG